MSSRSGSFAPVGSVGGRPVGGDRDGVEALKSGNNCITGRGLTSAASTESELRTISSLVPLRFVVEKYLKTQPPEESRSDSSSSSRAYSKAWKLMVSK